MTYQILAGEGQADADYTPRGGCKELIYNHDPEVIAEGPAECLAGETVIHDFLSGQDYTIQELCEKKIAPMVLTLFGIKQASIPFKKGKGDLYRVTLKSGHSFLATQKHIVLTSDGWRFVGSLQISERLLGYEPIPRGSNSEYVQRVPLQDALRLSKTVPGYQGSCFACFLPLCDEQPRPEEDSAQEPAPLPAGVLEHIRDDHNMDGRASLSKHNHPRQYAVRLSSLNCAPLNIDQTLDAEYFEREYRLSRDAYSFQSLYQFYSGWLLLPPVFATTNHFSDKRSCLSPFVDYTVFGGTVSSVEYVRTDDYYDMTVPNAGHYVANGIIHHNTGKTLAACWKLHLLASKYPKSQWVIVRKIQRDLYGSVLQTWERVIKGAPVTIYGGEKPEKYIYNNGATVWVAGMDNPGKVLSSERDGMYVNQAEQLALDDWENITTRVTGRNAVVPFPQLFGDCNPAGSKHWIRTRNQQGALKLIRTVHQDNPTLYTDDGKLTEQGKRTMARLDNLTGVRKKRLKEGIWATAEGAVYDTFDSAIHVMERQPSEMVDWMLGMDEGYTNPAVILLVGIDSDGRWHVFKEWYERGKLESVVVAQAKEWYLSAWQPPVDKDGETPPAKQCSAVAVDEAAAGLIAALRNAGIPANGAKGRVLDGIQHIQDRLKVQPDGLPRLTLDPSCVNSINEFESYVWKQTTTGTAKDEPLKENDHAMDTLRYLDDAAVPVQIFV